MRLSRQFSGLAGLYVSFLATVTERLVQLRRDKDLFSLCFQRLHCGRKGMAEELTPWETGRRVERIGDKVCLPRYTPETCSFELASPPGVCVF